MASKDTDLLSANSPQIQVDLPDHTVTTERMYLFSAIQSALESPSHSVYLLCYSIYSGSILIVLCGCFVAWMTLVRSPFPASAAEGISHCRETPDETCFESDIG
ncbi:hypothetical protein [Egbenema bharatensis]|uniref:hypothetical protein n=1 Tax=Egbenema bharatensis TaxID=3463334 RepID=UPI003A85B115